MILNIDGDSNTYDALQLNLLNTALDIFNNPITFREPPEKLSFVLEVYDILAGHAVLQYLDCNACARLGMAGFKDVSKSTHAYAINQLVATKRLTQK